MEKVKGLRKKKALIDTDNRRPEGEVGEVEEGKGGQMVREQDFPSGGEHTVQHTDDVL